MRPERDTKNESAMSTTFHLPHPANPESFLHASPLLHDMYRRWSIGVVVALGNALLVAVAEDDLHHPATSAHELPALYVMQ